MISRDNNLLNISWLCEIVQVSRSGFYAWKKRNAKRIEREKKDEKDFELILAAFNKRGYSKGSRSIHMTLLHQGVVMNRKKIIRLMKKFNLVCPIRKSNPHKQAMKYSNEQRVKDNLVNRHFKMGGPKTILLTDITYLYYGKGKIAYLSTIKDAYTNQILSYELSESLKVDIVLSTVSKLMKKHHISKNKKLIIHSDQGIHYTCTSFQELVSASGLKQSMSRKGNCWDNAPEESFFGHMKDEIKSIKGIHVFQDLVRLIDDYIDYYNNDRFQIGLAKLSPNQFETYIKTGDYPLIQYQNPPAVPISHYRS